MLGTAARLVVAQEVEKTLDVIARSMFLCEHVHVVNEVVELKSAPMFSEDFRATKAACYNILIAKAADSQHPTGKRRNMSTSFKRARLWKA